MFKKKENSTNEKKPKIKKIRKKRKISINSIFFLLISLVLTAALFIGLIVLENKLNGKVIYTKIVAAKKTVEKGVVITEDNADKYFYLRNYVISDVPDGGVQKISDLIGYRTSISLIEDEIVLMKDFENLETKTQNIKTPVQVAISAGSLINTAGGTIREGDIVNIAITSNSGQLGEKYSATYLMENVYVSAALNSNGVKIPSSDMTTPATILLLIIEKDDELVLTKALANSQTLRISKVR